MKNFTQNIMQNFRNNKKVYIGILVAVIVALVAIFFGSSKSNEATNESAGTGISDIYNTTSTSTAGAVNNLQARSVDTKAAYSRIQSEWVWFKTTYSNPAWAPVGPVKGKDFVLKLNEDKTLFVIGDCNTIRGTYTVDKNTVSGLESEDEMALGTIKFDVTGAASATTASGAPKKSCEWSKEKSFLADLAKVTSYDMRTIQLDLMLPNGQGVMKFKRNMEIEG